MLTLFLVVVQVLAECFADAGDLGGDATPPRRD